MFEYLCYGVVFVLVGLVLLRLREKLEVWMASKNRKKRNEYEGVMATDDDGEDEERLPLELGPIQRHQLNFDGENSEESDGHDAELTLFDNQADKTKFASHSEERK